MILVLLGTQNYSFKRLLEKIQEMTDKKVINDKVVYNGLELFSGFL